MEENLNIQYHTQRLLIKALNQEKTAEAAAPKLGIAVRTVYRYRKMFNIKLVGGTYQVVDKNIIKI